MKKVLTFFAICFMTLCLTACGETNLVFKTKPFETGKNAYYEFMKLATSQHAFVENLKTMSVTNNKDVYNARTALLKETSDEILLVMPIFDLGQTKNGKNDIYPINSALFDTYLASLTFGITQEAQNPNADNNTYYYNATSNSVGLEYVCETSYNSSSNETTFKINLSLEDSTYPGNNKIRYYEIKFDDASSYFYFKIAETKTSQSFKEVEYYSLKDDIIIARIYERIVGSNVASYNTDIVIDNYDAKIKYYNVASSTKIRGLKDISGKTFGIITQEEKNKAETNIYSFDICQGAITAEKVEKI